MADPTQSELENATSEEAIARLMAAADQAEQELTTEGAEGVGSNDEIEAAVTAAGKAEEGETPAKPDPAAPGATPGTDKPDESSVAHGVQSKDGQRILPYKALEEARLTAVRERDLRKSLERELAELKAGKTEEVVGLSAEELASMQESMLEADFAKVKKMDDLLKAAAKAGTGQANQAEIDQRQITEVELAARREVALMDRPLLTRFETKGGAIWNRACELDAEVRKDPAFAAAVTSHDLAAIFTEVEKRLSEETGIPIPQGKATTAAAPSPSSAAKPGAPAPAARPAPEDALPNSLSDLNGGSSPDAAQTEMDQANPMALVQRFAKMNDAQIETLIARQG